MAVCPGARQPSVLELRRRAQSAGFANGGTRFGAGKAPRVRQASRKIEAYRLGAIEEQVDIMLVELAEMLRSEHGAVFTPSNIWRFLDRHSMTVKKAHASEQERPDLLAWRHAWFKAQPDLDPERLVFIDETGVSTKMARLRGRARRGIRCRPPIPHGHWKTTTFTGALRLTGMTAPMVLDGPMTGEWFAAYAKQVLAPTLHPGGRSRGLMDQARLHTTGKLEVPSNITQALQ